jgi:hypothetical protein
MVRGVAFAAVAAGVLLCTGCSPSINYSVSGAHAIENKSLGQLTLSIQPLVDKRKALSYFKEELFDRRGGTDEECYNFEFRYKKIIPAEKMSLMLAKHLDSSRLFKKVTYNNKESADLFLAGDIISFAGRTNVNETARTTKAVGSQFGLIGAVVSTGAVATMKSFFDLEIKYSNIVVSDKKGNILYNIPEFTTNEQKEIGAVTNCAQVYGLLNAELKKHNQKLIDKIAAEMPAFMN